MPVSSLRILRVSPEAHFIFINWVQIWCLDKKR